MVARSMPVGINPRPKPKTDEDRPCQCQRSPDEVERLKKLMDVMERNMNGIIKAAAEIQQITRRMDNAA